MYSPEVLKAIGQAGAAEGDRICVRKDGQAYEGILLPRLEMGRPDCIVIKLENGYNLGLKYNKETTLSLLEKGKALEFKPATLPPQPEGKQRISIMSCGGTIASRIEYKTGAAFPAYSPADLIEAFPQLNGLASYSSKKLFSLLSEDMAPAHWQEIAKAVAEEIKQGVDGVVLMHGTDTMGYTAAALSFMLRNLPVPVVLVGAQRSSDRGSSDNELNLISSVLAAKSDIAEVSLCMHASMNDDYAHLHLGTRARKLHTSRRDAFQTVGASPWAKIYPEKKTVEQLRGDYRKRGSSGFRLEDKMNQNVALIWVYPGIKPEFIASLNSFDGVVLAGTGLGHVPTNPFGDSHAKSIVPEIKNLVSSGIPVAIAPQTIFGRLNLGVYTAGRVLQEAGVVGDGCDWIPETALVKMMWALGQTKDANKVRELMLTPLANEITPRSVVP